MESLKYYTQEQGLVKTLAFSSIHENERDLEKQRKLTVDSGFGDDITDRRDSLLDECFSMNSSLDCINEDDFRRHHDKSDMDEVIQSYENIALDEKDRGQLSPSQPKTERKRRVTPVPRNICSIKPSQGSASQRFIQFITSGANKFLFVEEEDADDLEKYTDEDDFICPDVILMSKRYTNKRNSWHGRTEDEELLQASRREITLTKTKSLDRGKNYPRRRRRNNMSTSSPIPKCLSFDKTTHLGSDELKQSTTEVQSKTTCYSCKNMNKSRDKEASICPIEISVDLDSNSDNTNRDSLPLWMKEAEAELMSSSDTGSDYIGDESYLSPEEDTLSTNLKIPNMDWEKINEAKNKNNEILKNQRRMITKQKNRAQRRRKLTPSEFPSGSSLEKLSNLKCSANEWKVLEEDEEEQEQL